MKNEQLSDVEFIDRFPQLARARELFIQSFRDHSPLINLGYTRQQIEYTVPVLKRLELGGIVGIEPDYSYLSFTHPEDSDIKLFISHYKDSPAYYLIGWRSPYVPEDVPQRMREFYRFLREDDAIRVFKKHNDKVIDVVQVDVESEKADTTDLHQLIETLYVQKMCLFPRLQSKLPLASIGKMIGLTSTYEAAWVSQDYKLEFVVKIQNSRRTKHEAWRRLNPLTDEEGTVIPFGQKANITDKQITDTLASQREHALIGKLAFGEVDA